MRRGIACLAIVLAVGTAGFAWLTSRPGRIEPPPSVRQRVSVDCILVTHASAWLDVNVNGTRESGELPLAGVRFELDNDATHRQNVTEAAVSAADGTATVQYWLPGCPEVAFSIRALGPGGYRSTTPPVQAADERVQFGFIRDGEARP